MAGPGVAMPNEPVPNGMAGPGVAVPNEPVPNGMPNEPVPNGTFRARDE